MLILPLQDSLNGPMTGCVESPLKSENPCTHWRASDCYVIVGCTLHFCLLNCFLIIILRNWLLIYLLTAQTFPASLQFSWDRKETMCKICSLQILSLYSMPCQSEHTKRMGFSIDKTWDSCFFQGWVQFSKYYTSADDDKHVT